MILQALYFFIPAYISNMIPVFVKRINFLNYPIDANKTWRGKRILGDHKTWRGLFFGTLSGFLIFELQRSLYNKGILTNLALINYSTAPIFLGALLGFAALFGDSLKSFFKRQMDIRPGKPWVPFDQFDFLVTTVIITIPWSGITLIDSLLVLTIIFFLTIIVQYSGYKLKLKNDKL